MDKGEWAKEMDSALFGFAPARGGLTPATGRNGSCSFLVFVILFCFSFGRTG